MTWPILSSPGSGPGVTGVLSVASGVSGGAPARVSKDFQTFACSKAVRCPLQLGPGTSAIVPEPNFDQDSRRRAGREKPPHVDLRFRASARRLRTRAGDSAKPSCSASRCSPAPVQCRKPGNATADSTRKRVMGFICLCPESASIEQARPWHIPWPVDSARQTARRVARNRGSVLNHIAACVHYERIWKPAQRRTLPARGNDPFRARSSARRRLG